MWGGWLSRLPHNRVWDRVDFQTTLPLFAGIPPFRIDEQLPSRLKWLTIPARFHLF